jgi:hypothetical protein
MLNLRLARPEQLPDSRWQRLPVAPHGGCRLGISFRPRQVEAFGLDGRATLEQLLMYPFQVIRLAAYWDRFEPRDGAFDTGELDWQLEAAERAGKQVILGVGAVKNFGYPEVFVPKHQLATPLKEGSLVTTQSHPALLAAAKRFISRVVARYKSRMSIVAWQLEQEAVDPLGVEHSWRLSEAFVRSELEALKEADPGRPVVMNGFLPMSPVVAMNQRWRTRDQGDSLAVAARLVDIVGVDYYPRHALVRIGPRTLYVNGSGSSIPKVAGRRVMFTEGQGEPWETTTTPPNPASRTLFSCGPEQLIRNFNVAISARPEAYLFWGAEYWIRRSQSGDPSYLQAFERILAEA